LPFQATQKRKPYNFSGNMNFDALKDYYRILRIPMDACLETIKKAYRSKAMECHPDRGGSHQAMLDVIEAFQILANSETRRHYDDARHELFNQNTQTIIQSDISRARENAENYPRDWNDFDSWLQKDFANAEYGKLGYLPTVSKSVSGQIFLIAGLIVGVVVIYIFAEQTGWSGQGGGLTPFLVICGCGVVGLWLHRAIANSIRPPAAPPPSSSNPQGTMVARCSQCDQQLRVRLTGKKLRLRCPRCKFAFDLLP
jgi:hypothetical protein